MPANAGRSIASEHRNYSQSLYELEYTESIRSLRFRFRMALGYPLSLIAAALSVLECSYERRFRFIIENSGATRKSF